MPGKEYSHNIPGKPLVRICQVKNIVRIFQLKTIDRICQINTIVMIYQVKHIVKISNIRHKDFLCPSVLCSSVMLVLPPLKSETGWTEEIWSNCVLLIFEN